MKYRLTALLSLSILLVTGCTTTSILGLSRASYVDELEQRQSDRFSGFEVKNRERESRIEEELEQIRDRDNSELTHVQEDVAALQAEMEDLRQLSLQVDELTRLMEKAGEDTKELQILSEQFKARMETIYKDTLHVLVTALEQYIEEPDKL